MYVQMQDKQLQLSTIVMDRYHRSEVSMLKEQQKQHHITLLQCRRYLQV